MGRRLAFEKRTAFDPVEIGEVFAAFDRVERRPPAVFATEPPVAQQRIDLVIAGRAPHAVLFPEEHR
jgi:hypothetical protein